MPTEDPSSTVPRRQLGRHLRELRDEARLTAQDAARLLEWSGPKIWRIETGQIPMRGHDVETMCRIYGVDPEMTKALVGLASQTRAKGWWHSYGDAIPKWFKMYVGLEAAANHICDYENEVVPGLLQTEPYMQAIMRADDPNLTEEEYARRVSVRLERQGLLTRQVPEPPQLDYILHEGVVRRSIPGDPDIMAGQLARMLDLGELENISIRVLPLAAGLHRASIAGAFTILDFPAARSGRTEPPVVYSEGATGALYLDKPKEVAIFREIWEGIKGVSLDEGDSRVLISKIAEGIQ